MCTHTLYTLAPYLHNSRHTHNFPHANKLVLHTHPHRTPHTHTQRFYLFHYAHIFITVVTLTGPRTSIYGGFTVTLSAPPSSSRPAPLPPPPPPPPPHVHTVPNPVVRTHARACPQSRLMTINHQRASSVTHAHRRYSDIRRLSPQYVVEE